MATDVMLIIIPMPWLARLRLPIARRLQLIGIFSIGILLVIIAMLRLPIGDRDVSQHQRHTWGAVEGFCAAFVANVPTLYSLRRRQDRKGPRDGAQRGENQGIEQLRLGCGQRLPCDTETLPRDGDSS
ncbi:hypothetical protein N7530_000014 [Penicillium desertorum]|uniref:Rhodopsin domain-containing protein n=1 Tax=Penicillium desertorum TaxID=1303715 RepID=A0A9X0BV06_9EURO|nr:hypothetical protein N7530_000014 [Penicillium desertorum]